MDDLFTRRKKLREMEDSDFWKFMWNLSKNKWLSYMKDGNGYLVTNREELALVSKNEAIEEYLEWLDWSEDEHTDFIVNVFMRD